ncbi:MAG: extracellular solute-binding protein, partial [Defluviitaleaceae bacterium]|nr:extracellular solute-binding protein [Defluviitaleaceae bacterium]
MKNALKFLSLMLVMTMLFALVACGNGAQAQPETPADPPPAQQQQQQQQDDDDDDDEPAAPAQRERTYLTVLTWDRGGEGHQDSADNFFTRWIAEQVYEDLNMVVTFHAIDRWNEHELLPAMFAAGTVPDLAMSWNGGMVQTFGRQGGILNVAPLLHEHLPNLPYLDNWLDNLLWQNEDPASGEVFSIMQRRPSSALARTGTFIRADWLDALGIPVPTTHEEFIDALRAFRDNADVLGVPNMVPLAMTQDVRWRASTLLESFIDPNMTDEERFVHHVGDRFFLFPGYQEGARLLNLMYNEGLIFQDFVLHDGDEATDNMVVAGHVGAYIHNWDNLWRSTPDIMNRLNEINPDARFIPIDPFPNPQTGLTQKFTYEAHGFHVFLPHNSSNPVGALEYLNWMSQLENRLFLQTGLEGIHHEIINVEGYDIRVGIPVDQEGPHRMYSPGNVDLTLVVGFPPDFGSNRANALAASLSYPGINPQLVVDSMETALLHGRQMPVYTVPGG